jgi:sirohydrochlorin ferrochelatase
LTRNVGARLASPSGTGTSALLMGHGSSSSASRRELLELRQLVEERLTRPVAIGVLEFPAPELPALAQAFALLGPTPLVAAQPLVLFEGLHGRHDMPREAAAAARELGLEVHLGTPFGADAVLADLALRRLADTNPREGDVLLFAGRGSSVAGSLRETEEVAARIAGRAGLPHVICHAGISRPGPVEGMRLASRSARRVIVLPWLIHAGVLADRVHELTAATARECGVEAVQLPHIGNGPELVGLIASRLEALV